jgi:hypothetical protein
MDNSAKVVAVIVKPRAIIMEHHGGYGSPGNPTRVSEGSLGPRGEPDGIPRAMVRLAMKYRRASCLMSLTAWMRPRRLLLKPR